MAQVIVATRAPFAYEAITVSSAAIGLTLSTWNVNAREHSALLALESNQIRYTLDGSTTPTSSVGHLMNIGDSLILENSDALKNFKAIRVSGDASLKVTYFKR